jgi:hypothetical protein
MQYLIKDKILYEHVTYEPAILPGNIVSYFVYSLS